MSPRKKGSRENLRSGIKNLILQEVRILRLERAKTPRFIIEAESHSIREAKRDIVRLAELIAEGERTALLKKMVSEMLDEEIDRAIQLRNNRCLRCIHMRYYDGEGMAHIHLPLEASQAQIIGCDIIRTPVEERCQRFVETTGAISLEDYLNEMALLYEFREWINRIEEIWKNYLLP